MGDPKAPGGSRPADPAPPPSGTQSGGSSSSRKRRSSGDASAESTTPPRLRVFQGRRADATTDGQVPGAMVGSPDDLLVRLQTLEAQVEDALARSQIRGGGVGQDLLAEFLNTAIGLYAELRHRLGGMENLFVRLRMLGRGLAVDDYGYDPVVAGWMNPVLDVLYQLWWRVDVVNLDRVPARGPVMFVANHGGALLPYDALMIAAALRRDHPARRRARPLVEDYLWDSPHLGILLSRMGAVRSDPGNARRILADGGAVIVFPEGAEGLGKAYRDRYRVGAFGPGEFVSVCLATRAVLVPVSVVGAEETHPLLGRAQTLGRLLGLPYLPVTPTFPWLGLLGVVPLPTKWTIRFGEPLNLAARHEERDPEDLALVGRLREDVRQRIQRMVLESLRRRRSIFFG